jgi:N-acetylglucosaminyldiphosphoundecaprenol N-acetyl-beta-D-mannosaminyltransferase
MPRLSSGLGKSTTSDSTPDSLSRANILGVGISAITAHDALDQIANWIRRRERQYVCVCTVHTVMECQRSPDMRSAVNGAGLATPDGMPLVWLGRAKSGRHVRRVYGPDLMLALCQRSLEEGYSHYFYGGGEGIAELLAHRLAARFPGLETVGTHSPPFRPLTPDEDGEDVARINAAHPDVVWVGLGTPRQDLWMASHRKRLTASVLIGVGAAFDFHTGCKPQAPRWMQRTGLEWFFRLLTEPRRLWRRYLINNPLFIALVLCQALGLRRYSLGSSPPVR